MTTIGTEEEALDTGPNPSCMDPLDTGNGVTVLVTCCAVKGSEDSHATTVPNSKSSNPFASKRGLSCVSLEVLTSGEHLDDLSLEDISDAGSSKGSSQGSIPECESLEGEVKLEDCCGEGRVEGEKGKYGVVTPRSTLSEQEKCPDEGLGQELVCPEEYPSSPPTVVEGKSSIDQRLVKECWLCGTKVKKRNACFRPL